MSVNLDLRSPLIVFFCCLITGWPIAHATPMPHYQNPVGYFEDFQDRRLSDFTLFDAYQLKTDDAKLQTEFGTILFLYRDLQRCRKVDICRRLAMAWLSPDGRMIELQVPEQVFDQNRLHRNSAGIGLGLGNTVSLPVPRRPMSQQIVFQTSGRDGEEALLVVDTEHGPVSRTLRRVTPMDSVREVMKSSNYFQPAEDLFSYMSYLVGYQHSQPRLIIASSRSIRVPESWQVALVVPQPKGPGYSILPNESAVSVGRDTFEFGLLSFTVKDRHAVTDGARIIREKNLGQLVLPANTTAIGFRRYANGDEIESLELIKSYSASAAVAAMLNPPLDPFYEMLLNSNMPRCPDLLK